MSTWRFVRDKKCLVSIGLSVVYCVLVAPMSERYFYRASLATNFGPQMRPAIYILFGVLLALAVFALLSFLDRLRLGDRRTKLALGVGLALFAVNLIVLVATWPGYWLWDDYSVINYLYQGDLHRWQNILTAFYFACCVFLVPSGVGVVIVQVVIASVVGGYVVFVTAGFVPRPKLAFLVALPLLSFPVLLNNMYPLRMTAYTYLQVAVVFYLLDVFGRRGRTPTPLGLVVLLCGIGLLSSWRTEGLYWLIAGPAVVVATARRKRIPALKLSLAAAVGGSLIVAMFAVTSHFADPKYQLTGFINPLTLMLQHDLKGSQVAEDLKAIDKVVSVDMMRARPDPSDVRAYWDGGVREGFESHTTDFYRAYADLVINNPRAFFEARLRTFALTNALGNKVAQVRGASPYTSSPDSRDRYRARRFVKTNHGARPLNRDLRSATVRTLLVMSPDGTPRWPARIIWNVVPPIILTLAVVVAAVIRRKWWLAGVSSLVFLQAPLIFLTAPASFFMYYLPVYTSGWLLVFFAALQLWARRRSPSRDAATT